MGKPLAAVPILTEQDLVPSILGTIVPAQVAGARVVVVVFNSCPY